MKCVRFIILFVVLSFPLNIYLALRLVPDIEEAKTFIFREGYSEEELKHRPPFKPGKFSVVLVDFNETLLYKTVDSILFNTSKELLGEILVIDDGSPIPVSHPNPIVRIVRNDVRTGLIAARNLGGNEAAYEYIAMMDCHIKVAEGWLEEPYRLMKENYRTVVNPVVFSLNVTTYEFFSALHGIGSSAGFYWSLIHRWSCAKPGTMISAGTMGEFFITKKWWTEVNGMDKRMKQWGAENIEISLKTWLCGGRIVVAKSCFIAHGFRKIPYKIDGYQIRRNYVRLAETWLGEEYINNFYKARGLKRGSVDFGDISENLKLKERLKCHNFSWFVKEFKGVSPCWKEDKKCGSYNALLPKDIPRKFW